jgi:hypothetical protein
MSRAEIEAEFWKGQCLTLENALRSVSDTLGSSPIFSSLQLYVQSTLGKHLMEAEAMPGVLDQMEKKDGTQQ